jgi:hypothetical protein
MVSRLTGTAMRADAPDNQVSCGDCLHLISVKPLLGYCIAHCTWRFRAEVVPRCGKIQPLDGGENQPHGAK